MHSRGAFRLASKWRWDGPGWHYRSKHLHLVTKRRYNPVARIAMPDLGGRGTSGIWRILFTPICHYGYSHSILLASIARNTCSPKYCFLFSPPPRVHRVSFRSCQVSNFQKVMRKCACRRSLYRTAARSETGIVQHDKYASLLVSELCATRCS